MMAVTNNKQCIHKMLTYTVKNDNLKLFKYLDETISHSSQQRANKNCICYGSKKSTTVITNVDHFILYKCVKHNAALIATYMLNQRNFNPDDLAVIFGFAKTMNLFQLLINYKMNVNMLRQQICHAENLILLKVIKNKNLDALQILFDAGLLVNKSINTHTIYNELFKCQEFTTTNKEILTLLIDHGFDVNLEANCDIGSSPLLHACKCKNHELIEFLLRHGANPNYLSNMQIKYSVKYPLLVCCENDDIDGIMLLLQYGANPLIKNKSNENIIMEMAVKENHLKVIELMVDFGEDPNFMYKFSHSTTFTKNAIISALQENSTTLFNKILPLITDLNQKCSKNNTYLHYACKVANYEIIKTLLEKGSAVSSINNINDSKKSPLDALKLTSTTEYNRIVALLLQYGANPFNEENNCKFIMKLILNNNLDIIKTIFKYCNKSAISKIIKHNIIGENAHLEKSTNTLQFILNLIKKYCDNDHLDLETNSKQLCCCKNDFCKNDFCKNSKTQFCKKNCLMKAITQYHISGLTPLHIAVSHKNYGLVETLLRKKVDPNVNILLWNHTAYSIAKKNKDKKMKQLLLAYGAKPPSPKTTDVIKFILKQHNENPNSRFYKDRLPLDMLNHIIVSYQFVCLKEKFAVLFSQL